MTPEQAYQTWAPPAGHWSPWVKPVVFAHLHQESAVEETVLDGAALPGLSGVPAADGAAAVVVDLPGAAGARVGIDLARQGYRPIPLYNAVPLPVLALGNLSSGPAAVDLHGIAAMLTRGAEALNGLRLPYDAPPAFLLDARRRIGDNPARLGPGVFDNRSVSLPSDFPSANMLLSSGLTRVVVIASSETGAPQTDLAHTLLRWQDAGITIELLRIGVNSAPETIEITRPRWYRHAWHAMLVKLGLRPHLLGGFGGFIPIPSAG